MSGGRLSSVLLQRLQLHNRPLENNPFSSKDRAWGLWCSWFDFMKSLTPGGGICVRRVSHSISIIGETINWRCTVCLLGQASYAQTRSGLTVTIFTEHPQLSILFPSSHNDNGFCTLNIFRKEVVLCFKFANCSSFLPYTGCRTNTSQGTAKKLCTEWCISNYFV